MESIIKYLDHRAAFGKVNVLDGYFPDIKSGALLQVLNQLRLLLGSDVIKNRVLDCFGFLIPQNPIAVYHVHRSDDHPIQGPDFNQGALHERVDKPQCHRDKQISHVFQGDRFSTKAKQ